MRSHQKNEKMRQRYAGLTDEYGRWNGSIRLLEDNLELPLKVRQSTLFSIWNDLFHPDASRNFIEDAFQHMAQARQHFFLILTKRPERMNQLLCGGTHLANVGLGVTVELPKYLHRIETLLQIPAALHFVSLEPLLGEMSLLHDLYFKGHKYHIDWVQMGCESGGHRRPMQSRWAECVIKDCKEAGVPLFFKQMEREGKLVHAPKLTNGKPLLQFPEVEWSP